MPDLTRLIYVSTASIINKLKLSEIKDYKGRGNELVSLYVSPSSSISNVQAIIDQGLRSLEDYDEGTRMKYSVRDTLNCMKENISELDGIPKTGVIVFAGRVEGDTRCRVFSDEIDGKVRETTYVTGSQFSTERAERIVSVEDPQIVVVLDTGKMLLGHSKGGSVSILDEIREDIPSKHSKGGQSQSRFERRRSEYKKEFFRECEERINNYASNGEAVFIGGPEITVKEFINKTNIESLVDVITVTTEYVNEVGLQKASERATEYMDKKDRRNRIEAVERFMRSVKDDEPPTHYGLENVEKAIEYGAVDELIVENGKFDDLAERSKSKGASVTRIDGNTDKGQMFIDAFDGIGAILNYQIT